VGISIFINWSFAISVPTWWHEPAQLGNFSTICNPYSKRIVEIVWHKIGLPSSRHRRPDLEAGGETTVRIVGVSRPSHTAEESTDSQSYNSPL